MNVSSSATNEQSNSKKNNKNNKKQQQQQQHLIRSNTVSSQHTKSSSSSSSSALTSSKQHLNNITNSLNSPDASHKLMQKSNSNNDNKYSSVYYVSPKLEKKSPVKKNNSLAKNKSEPTNNKPLVSKQNKQEDNKLNESKQEILLNDNNDMSKLVNNNNTKDNENTNLTKQKPDIRARYWAYLFDNLKRAVDEIYQTCENDNRISECKEVILILENCTNDFRSLINRILLMKDFDKANLANKRVNSLAWEVRKSSPRKANDQKASSLRDSTGFKEFLPIYNAYDDEDDDDDDMDSQEVDVDDADDDDDYTEYKYKSKKKEINPIDLYNHETFSDMQSINTDDISLNTLSITPPLVPTPNKQTQIQPQSIPLSSTKSELSEIAPQLPSFSVTVPTDIGAELFSVHSEKFQNNFQQSLFFSSLPQLNQHTKQTNFFSLPPPPHESVPSTLSNPYYQSFSLDLLNSNLISSLTNIPNSSLTSNLHLNSNVLLNESFDTSLDDYAYRDLKRSCNFRESNFKVNLVVDEEDEDDVEDDDDDLDDYFDNENYPDYDELNYDDFTFKLVKKSKSKVKQTQTTSQETKLRSNLAQTASETKKLEEDLDDENNFDPIDQVMLKAYEEEENLVLEIEKVQNKELLSVIAQEVKLTKQLSAEKLIHFNHQKYLKNKENDLQKNSTDFETFEMNEKKRQRQKMKAKKLWDNEDLQFKLNEEFEAELDTIRTPGRALQMHEKLLSMSRKASPNERRRKHEEKQARAQEKREQFYQDRSKKLRELTKKIEEVRELKKKLLKVKKATMKAKLQRAEEKRQYLLRLKAKKAAVEEQKAHEIAFINNLVAQNRKHDILERYEKRHEAIKHNLEEERMRKQEEQKAKEQAAELRRKELETQRMTKLKEMLEKRRLKQSKIEQTQLEKEKERIETAKAKERTREMRLAIIEAQFQANKQEVKKRIIQKQEEWSKRHESNLEEIRKKAFEMSILHFSTEDTQGGVDAPTPVPYERAKYCNVCNVVINTEVQLKSHLRGIKHQQTMNEKSQGKHLTKSEIEEFNLNCIIDSPKETNEREMLMIEERKKAMKKRLKKVKNKILNKGVEYESMKKKQANSVESTSNLNANKSKIPKLIKDLEKILNSNENKQTNVDRICGELNRMIVKNQNDQEVFKANDGLNICVKLLEQICQTANDVHTNPSKTIINIVTLLSNASKNYFDACSEIILSNKLLALLDLLNIHSNVMLNEIVANDSANSSIHAKSMNQKYLGDWLICSSLIQLVGGVYSTINNEILNETKNSERTAKDQTNLISRATDFLSLITSFGFIDLFSVFFSNIRGPLDDEQQTAEILKNCLNFLISLSKFLALKNSTDVFSDRKPEDTTQLISTFKTTNLVNIISMLYGMLHKDASTPVKYDQTTNSADIIRKQQPFSTLELTTLSLKLLNQMTVLDLNMVQSSLGEESLSLQLRHIASYLIWYLSTNKYEELLHEVILLIGYFTVLNNENQIKMELGTPPTILQQLCNLPFNYFSDKKLISILYPTLICCCFDNEKNKFVLTTELSSDMLANYIQEKLSDENFKLTNTNAKEDKFEFSKRFPISKWNQACEYFLKKQ